MSNLSIKLKWTLNDGELSLGKYSTDHKIKINDQILINGSSAVEYGGNPNNLNPEQGLAAAISSCHMMTFLALAAKMKWPVITYEDKAVAYLGKNSNGNMCVNKIELNPQINFQNNFKVSKEELSIMHDRSHRYCFIANSLSTEVEVVIS